MIVAVAAGVVYSRRDDTPQPVAIQSKYGAYLAAQHAIYVNDFERAAEFTAELSDVDNQLVHGARYLAEFLSGHLPAAADTLSDDKSASSRLIYDAYLVTNDKWAELYRRYKKDDSAINAPLRIWATIAVGKQDEALRFIKKLKTNESWKSFMRGMIYAEKGDVARAADEFFHVRPEFMNINDYMYITSFYTANNMTENADALRADFTSRPGGMFMLEYNNAPAWETFSGNKNALAFSLIQTVSHTQIMMYTDLSILLLRTAQIIGGASDGDTINYYLGQYFFNNNGDYGRFFNEITSTSPYYPFAMMRMAGDDTRKLSRVVEQNPLFVPAMDALVARHVAMGHRRAALRIINRALRDKNLTDGGRAFLQKRRAAVYFTFGNLDAAATDIHDAANVFPVDTEILSIQAKIWAAQNRELDTANEYAMTLIKRDPTDIGAWDTLGRVMLVREGTPATLELIERVAASAYSCSALFELLGDLYVASGDDARARDAYIRAIDLSGDGLTIVPKLKKKLRNLK